MKAFVCVLMAVLMTNAPHIAAAEIAGEMIPTAVVFEEMTRAQGEAKINELLARKDVHVELEKLGLSKDEVDQRLATLSDAEVRQLATQIDQARYGGESFTGILIIVLLVVLIIYLAKRI